MCSHVSFLALLIFQSGYFFLLIPKCCLDITGISSVSSKTSVCFWLHLRYLVVTIFLLQSNQHSMLQFKGPSKSHLPSPPSSQLSRWAPVRGPSGGKQGVSRVWEITWKTVRGARVRYNGGCGEGKRWGERRTYWRSVLEMKSVVSADGRGRRRQVRERGSRMRPGLVLGHWVGCGSNDWHEDQEKGNLSRQGRENCLLWTSGLELP